jgi:polygalacturonase
MNFYKFLSLPLSILLCISSTNPLNIDDFGAVNDNSTYEAAIMNGKAFMNCLIAANAGRDRTVLIASGKNYTILPVARIENLVNVTILFDGIFFAWNGNHSLWPDIVDGKEKNAMPLISLYNTQGLVIKGEGIIEGNGYIWWWHVIIIGNDNRPNLLEILTSKDTLIDGITFRNAPRFHLNLMDQLNLTVQNVLIQVNTTDPNVPILDQIPTFPLNTDGIDIRGKNIIFRNLTIENFDDAIAVKPTHQNQDTFTNCTENILIEDCYVKYSLGMSIGSVPPNLNYACVRNITIRNIKFQDPIKAIYIKPNPGENGYGLISDITYENITINNALWWAIFIGTQQQHQPHSSGTDCSFFYPLPGTECVTNPRVTIQNITLRNVDIHGGLLSPGIIICNSTNPCTNLIFDNVNVYDRSEFPVAGGYLCENFSGSVRNSNLVPSCLKDLSKEDDCN